MTYLSPAIRTWLMLFVVSALAMLLVFVSHEPHAWSKWFIVITIAAVVFIAIMLVARYVSNFLGERGLIAIERLMGMILTAIAIQMFLTGIVTYFHLG